MGYGADAKGEANINGTPRMILSVLVAKTDNMLTLSNPNSIALGACHGDSGGPAYAVRGGVASLVGVVARGDCAGSSLAIPLQPYQAWLLEAAQQLGSQVNP
jgi:secreted trypsin-like serine protease